MRHTVVSRTRADGDRGKWGRCVVALVAATFLAFLAPGVAVADVAPHVPTELETDACAMCHRVHSSANDATWTVPGQPEENRSSLLLGVQVLDPESSLPELSVGVGDTALCYACHGVEALGSLIDVQTAFTSDSAHSLSPSPSEYGPSPKKCSSCHDSHGSERTLSGDPYPALLRAFVSAESTQAYYSGDRYCATCHVDRPNSIFDGLDVWEQTAHSLMMAAPASGTGIRCSNCHEPHGSDAAPLITPMLLPPAAPTTLTIDANDRALCLGCHDGDYGTWSGTAAYDLSGHAVSDATMTISGEWPRAGDSRLVGECQNCHAPMGRSDGDGGVLPKLTAAAGRATCDTCHSADSPVGAVAGDFAQFKFPPAEVTKLEVAVAYNAERLPNVFDRLHLYSQETTGALPFSLVGPREYDVPGATGDMVAADVRGLGVTELIIADSTAKRLVVASPDPLAGVTVSEYSIPTTPTLVAVGDVVLGGSGSGRAEIVVVSRSEETTSNSTLWMFGWDELSQTFVTVAGPMDLDDDASGLAVGRLTRADRDDIAVTAFSGPSLNVFSESTITPGTLASPIAHVTLDGPRGPSIGDADTGSPGNEIAIANSLEPLDTLSLFDPVTGLLDSYQTSAAAGASAWGTLIADVLPGFAGSETVVALRNNAGMSSINVFAHDGVSPLATRLAHNTGLHFASSSLAFGDVDSATNGRGELVVGNAGTWDETTVGNHVPPSVQVFRVNGAGDNLLAPDTYSAGGVEKAGNTPAVALADLGAVGGTRHPTSVPGDPNETLTAHNSTETAPFDLHVECTDCHNVHEATSTPSPAVANAPDIYGRLKGAWGVQVDYAPASTITYTERQGAVFEYEVCFKCHSGWTRTPDGPDDIAAQFDTRNMSFHLTRPGTTPAANTPGSFVDGAGWTTSSVLHCVDCHGNTEASQPVGPHSSGAAPLLKRPLWGLEPSDEDGLCYSCHKHSVYYTGADDRVPASTSNFYDDVLAEPKLHKRHVNDAGFSCETCHFPHGAKEHEHMIRPGLDWVHLDNGGACYTTCHGGSTINVYSRASALNPEVSATGISTNAGTYLNGDLASVQTAGDADYYQVRELQGNPAPSPLRVTLQFAPATPMATLPSSFRLQGRYDADTGHSLTVQALNHSTSSYVTLGSIPRSTVDDEYVYPLADPNYLSGAGSVTIRITKTTGGNTNNELFIDRAWLRY